MRPIAANPRFLPALLSVWVGLLLSVDAQAGDFQGKDGSVILRMCKSGDTVKTLSVMCHSYLDGFLDAAHHYDKGKPAFCLDAGDRKKAPAVLVEWIGVHPEALSRPAGAVMQQALTAHFPCKGRK